MPVSIQDYEYDIFISYRRMGDEWNRWTKEIFVKTLRTLLWPALGKVSIFLDDQMETGTRWPDHLARALAHSRVLIPLLCPEYFNSDWCRLELALMHHRAMGNPARMILPFIIDDGECFPEEIQKIQSVPIHDFARPYMRHDSPMREQFAEFLQVSCCPDIKTAIQAVPPFNPAWEEIAHEKFGESFRITMQAQTTIPGLSLSTIARLP